MNEKRFALLATAVLATYLILGASLLHYRSLLQQAREIYAESATAFSVVTDQDATLIIARGTFVCDDQPAISIEAPVLRDSRIENVRSYGTLFQMVGE